jgi:hypothetical protein
MLDAIDRSRAAVVLGHVRCEVMQLALVRAKGVGRSTTLIGQYAQILTH